MERRDRTILCRALCILLAIALGTGCTTVRPLEERWGGSYELRPGDRVRIVTHDGRELHLEVASLTAEGIVGKGTRGPLAERGPVTVPFSEISRIERAAFSGTRTGVTALGVGVVAGVVAFAAMLAYALLGIMGSFQTPDTAAGGPGPAPVRPER